MNTTMAGILIRAAAVLALAAPVLSPALAAAASIQPSAGTVLLQDGAAPADDWQTAAEEPAGALPAPPYAGLTVLSDSTGGFQLWIPAGWRVARYSYPDGSSALVIGKPGLLDTRFSIVARAIAAPKTVFDLPAMAAEFQALLNAGAGSQTEWQTRWHRGTVRGFEAMSTVGGSDQEIKRWVSLRYQGTRQYWLAAEAPSVADFDANWFEFMAMMYSFRVR